MLETLKIVASTVAKLRALLGDARKDLQRIQTLLTALTETLDSFWEEIDSIIVQKESWRETLSIIASGRALSVAAQAEQVLRAAATTPTELSKSWVSDGKQYSYWLGKGIALSSRTNVGNENINLAAQLCDRAFSLGHQDAVIEALVDELVLVKPSSIKSLQALTAALSVSLRKRFLVAILQHTSTRFLPGVTLIPFEDTTQAQKSTANTAISDVAAILKTLVSSPSTNAHDIGAWTVAQPCSHSMARAILAALPLENIKEVLRNCWTQFGDSLRMKHAPVLQQESTAQILLMAAGYVHRSNPTEVAIQARSTVHTSAVSTHLGSTSTRLRFLGMIVAMAISQLVDTSETRMKFSGEEFNTPEAKWYLNLIHVKDSPGSLHELQTKTIKPQPSRRLPPPEKKVITKAKPMIIEVVEGEEDDEDLIPYTKPDSDREDDEDDPTLIQRNKPKAPVYIRDLIAGLQDTENYDRHSLALSTAASLIRRKADFGSELKDRLEELGSLLAGLGDPFAIPGWHDMRQDAMVACLVADPKRMGVYYTRTFFMGDYSLSQRASILVVLGLGARELAGLGKEAQIKPRFPSQELPPRLQALYSESAVMDTLARRLEETMLRPVAKKQRTKTTRNQLASIVAESLFYPLTGYWQSVARSSHNNMIFQDPFLLPLFLKTLAIILAAAGPSAPSLPDMTNEFWQLLLSLRAQALQDPAILEAELFGFLTLLNVNEDRRQLAVDHSNEIVETQEWVGMVYERLTTADEDSERCKVLAAGILVAVKEMIDRYQRLMVGNLVLT